MGFAARLLGRAEGQITALRPQIGNLFAAEGGDAAPLLERSAEVVSTPPPAPTGIVSATEQSQTRAGLEITEPALLMPRQASEPAQVSLVSPAPLAPLVPVAAVPAPDRAERISAITDQTPEQPAPARTAHAEFAATTEPAPQPPRPERSSDSLLAAVTQLLGPQFQVEAESTAPRREVASPSDPFIASATQVNDPSAPASQQQPLQIHIGELVIAPESRAPQPEPPAAAQWQPPLSLDDYRASRTRAQS